jgi:uncharacterized membrane protein
MKNIIYIFTIIIAATFTFSCAKEKAVEVIPPTVNPCDTMVISFAVDVQPIFTNNCVTCHSAVNSSSFANGQVWETHAEISANTESILTAIKHDPGKTPMPYQGTKMSDSLIQIIDCWVAQGAQDN